MNLKEMGYMGDNVTVLCQNNSCTVLQMKDETGEGTMTCYSVLPGIVLLYNDFHMQTCFSQFQPNSDMLCIDHCREGRIEWEFDSGACVYIEGGDLQINGRENHVRNFSFPLRHYHGITIGINVEEAAKSLPLVLDGFPVDMYALGEKFCSGRRPFIMRAGASIEHIFSELYSVPDAIRNYYFKIKVLELLLFLNALEIPENGGERPYFYKTQVQKVKAIMEFMTAHPERRFTLDELSKKFEIPLTSMKSCFKGVYGTSIYSYMREYRMNKAAMLLSQTKESIASIAGQVGYDNSSKFAAAFKAVMGKSPQEYRKSSV